MSKKNYEELSKSILECVGGEDNISFCTHCLTRLRFNVKDKSLVDLEKVNQLDMVIGSQWSGEELQIIIGPNVKDVYSTITQLGSFETGGEIDENLDMPNEKLTFKSIGNKILAYVAASVSGCLPVIIAAGMAMTVNTIFGPTILNMYSLDSNIYQFINFLYEGCFYFLPVLLGYSAAKKLKLDPVYGIYMGAILITPSLINIVTAGEPFTVFGLSMPLVNYSQSMIPVLLSVWVLSIIYKYVNKYMPNALSSVLVPLLTMLIILPLSLFLLAPLGTILSGYVAMAITWFGNTFGFLGTALIAGVWILLVITGMHGAVYFAYLPTFLEKGVEYTMMPAAWAYTAATWGICIAAIIMLKKKEDKSLSLGYLATNFLGGVTEPTIFGLILKYKRLLACQMIGAFAGGLYLGITRTAVYTITGSSNFTSVLTFVAGGTGNVLNSVIGAIISIVVVVIVGCVWGLKDVNTEA